MSSISKIDRHYVFDCGDCTWDITFKREPKDNLSAFMDWLRPTRPSITNRIKYLTQYSV